MKIGSLDWSVEVLVDGRQYWTQAVASAHGRTTRGRCEGPFRRLDKAEKAARERLAEICRDLEEPIGPAVVATISDLEP